MIRHFINLLQDLYIIDQHTREHHAVCNLLVQRMIVQTHIALDDGIDDGRVEHACGKRFRVTEQGTHNEEIEQKLHFQSVTNLRQKE